jgi:hypothetical protein
MVTAVPENRGGDRPTAPQNNPMNINPMGGNGQSGRDYSGFAYGMNKEINQQKDGAKLAKAPTPTAKAPVTQNPLDSLLGEAVELDAPYEGALPVSDGVGVGRGRGEEALPTRILNPINQSQELDLIKKYLPDLMQATRLPGAPDSYKKLINYLKAQIL